MDSSRFKHKITIQSPQNVVDTDWGVGEVLWQDVATRIHAELQDVLPSRDESVKNGLVVGVNKTRIRIRYRKGIDSSMRVVVHGSPERILQIIGGPAVLGNREALEILCQEVTTDDNI